MPARRLSLLLLAAACGGSDPDDASDTTEAATTEAVTTTDAAPTTDAASTTDAAPVGPTYYQDIAPVLSERCGACHVAGGVAPFALSTYEQAEMFAPALRVSVELETMPPWPPGGATPELLYDRSLPEAERELLLAWVDAGAPEGDASDPAPLRQPEQAALPTVDLTTDLGADYVPDASLSDDYRCFVIDLGTTADQVAVGYQWKPGNHKTVHHVLSTLFTPESASAIAALDDADAGPGWSCFGGYSNIPGAEAVGSLGGWVPGVTAVNYPAGNTPPIATTAILSTTLTTYTTIRKRRMSGPSRNWCTPATRTDTISGVRVSKRPSSGSRFGWPGRETTTCGEFSSDRRCTRAATPSRPEVGEIARTRPPLQAYPVHGRVALSHPAGHQEGRHDQPGPVTPPTGCPAHWPGEGWRRGPVRAISPTTGRSSARPRRIGWVRKTAHREQPDRSIVNSRIGIMNSRIGIMNSRIGHREQPDRHRERPDHRLTSAASAAAACGSSMVVTDPAAGLVLVANCSY